MIVEQTLHVKPSNNNARNLTFGALAASLLLMAVYMAVPLYKGIVGMFTLAAIVTVVFIYSRYVGSYYFYDIGFDSSGVPVFVVRTVTGRRQSTLARISLADIVSLVREDAEARKNHKTANGVRKYFYSPTLCPKITYRMTVKSRYENAELIIEGSEEYAEMLRRYAILARENYPNDSVWDEE